MYCTVPVCTVLYLYVLFQYVLYFNCMSYAVQVCTVLCLFNVYTVLYLFVLYCTCLYCTVPVCTVLYVYLFILYLYVLHCTCMYCMFRRGFSLDKSGQWVSKLKHYLVLFLDMIQIILPLSLLSLHIHTG